MLDIPSHLGQEHRHALQTVRCYQQEVFLRVLCASENVAVQINLSRVHWQAVILQQISASLALQTFSSLLLATAFDCLGYYCAAP